MPPATSSPKLVKNEAKPFTIQIRIANLTDDFERTFDCEWH